MDCWENVKVDFGWRSAPLSGGVDVLSLPAMQPDDAVLSDTGADEGFICVAQPLNMSRGLLLLLLLLRLLRLLRLRLRLRLRLLLVVLVVLVLVLVLLRLRLRLRLRLMQLLMLMLLLLLLMLMLMLMLMLLPVSVSEARELDLVYLFAESCGTDLIGAHLQMCRCQR